MISGHANISLAVQATKMGAFDFLEKPLSLDRTMTVVRNALAIEDLRRENRTLRDSIFMDDRMVGDSARDAAVRELIAQAAASDSRILILGENGTGKELVAREVHARSARAAGPFVEVNCAAIPETLIESELFGHEKGAFTNALQRRRGKVETGGPRHALPGRDRRHVPGHPGEGAARPAGDALRAGRRGGADLGGRAGHRGHEQGHQGGDRARRGSARTCSSASTSCRSTCRRCASAWRTCPSWWRTSWRSSSGPPSRSPARSPRRA